MLTKKEEAEEERQEYYFDNPFAEDEESEKNFSELELRDKVRVKMARKGRKYKRDVKEDKGEGAKLISLHSGVLGLCAFVEAFPHDVPSFLPPILMELSTHLNDRQVCSFRKL